MYRVKECKSAINRMALGNVFYFLSNFELKRIDMKEQQIKGSV